MKQTALITGANGQLGQELQGTAPTHFNCIAITRGELNIADAEAVSEVFARLQPTLVINAAAYTAVDKAETEPEQSRAVNATGPENLALGSRKANARLIHISTDFVFDGKSSTPYLPSDATSPVSEYGSGKLAGERAVTDILPEALIIRTGWVYSRFGSNFVKTMLRLMHERTELSVVADQVGTPTWAQGLAQAVWSAASQDDAQGIYHWSDAGAASWYDFAQAIAEEALSLGLLSRAPQLLPIATQQYPTPAHRPAYSVLDKSSSYQDFNLEAVHWRVQLRNMLEQLKEHEND